MPSSRNYRVANPEGLSSACVLASFAAWLDARLGEAMDQGLDLAFRDRPFDVMPDRVPALIGWEHRLLAPGAPAPKGRAWTVYRLQDGRSVAHFPAEPASLDAATLLGVFDDAAAIYHHAARR
ncbi:MAG: hypothetical protein JWP92_215 [Caulobacter sp.]|nr:hypothetical protein [Caulobacter sp.]